MQIITTISALRDALKHQASIGFVPTMGNLHTGHLHLVEIAKQKASCVVVSIFVNPLQFGQNEDLANYPRTLTDDCDKLRQIGADIVFAPSVEEMYPNFNPATQDLGQSMTILPPLIAHELCGAVRPGHFSGVATVVLKLFNIVFFTARASNLQAQNIAVFGKKDFQQLMIIRELIKQFHLPIEIIASEIIRETDGLAMSSRNGYLSKMERSEAPRLNKVLHLVVQSVQKKGKQVNAADFASFVQQTAQYLTQLGWEVDYISIRSASTLLPAQMGDQHLIVLAAAKFGKTRLIDNIEFHIAS